MVKRGEITRLPGARARAFKAWMKDRQTNAKRVAAKAGVPYTTLASFVQGRTQELKGGNEQRVADAYGVSCAEIFGGREPRNDVRAVPIIDAVAAGKLASPSSQIIGDHPMLHVGGLPPGDYFATRVTGDSMDRLSPDGSLILVNRAEREPLPGRRYIFARRGQTTYKRFENDPLRLVPESTNPANDPIFPKSEEEWTVIGRVRLTMFDGL